MITLKKLNWDNCFSYGAENEIDLTSSTLTQVLGTNGVGKSSIPIILEEVLYNKNSKGVKKADIANRDLDTGYRIRLEFEKEGDEYIVEVQRKLTAKVSLSKNEEDISSHTATNTYKTIQDIIGIEFKTFSQIVYQNTNSSLQFLTATDTNRKKFLIELLNLDHYMKYYDFFKALSSENAKTIAELLGKKEIVESWLQNNIPGDIEVLPLLKIPNTSEEDEKSLRSLLVQLQNIDEKNSKIQKNNTYKKLLAQIPINELKSSTFKEERSTLEIQDAIGGLRQEIRILKNLLSKMEELDDVCHVCHQDINTTFKIGLINKTASQISEHETSLLINEAELGEYRSHNKKVLETKKQISEWENLFRSIDQGLQTDLVDEEHLKDEVQKLQEIIAQAKEEERIIISENRERAANNARIEVITKQTEEFTTKLEEVNNLLSKSQEKSSNVDMLKKTFSPNGLIAYKIENLITELEDLTNEYLAELSDGRFTLGFVVSKDKLNVEITDNGAIVDILALSSGELARVNTSTLLAIRKLMSSISNSKINVLFLDEVINVLDDSGREKLVEILLEEDLNTYLVSHGWDHPLLEKIEITKINNISRLEKG